MELIAPQIHAEVTSIVKRVTKKKLCHVQKLTTGFTGGLNVLIPERCNKCPRSDEIFKRIKNNLDAYDSISDAHSDYLNEIVECQENCKFTRPEYDTPTNQSLGILGN